MIATNHAAALFCRHNHLAVLYRGKPSQYHQMTFSSNFMRHDGLHIDGYCPVTSPNRKALDLLNHMYIKLGLLRIHRTNSQGHQNNSVIASREYYRHIRNLEHSLNISCNDKLGRLVENRLRDMRPIESFARNWMCYVFLGQARNQMFHIQTYDFGMHRPARSTVDYNVVTVHVPMLGITTYRTNFAENDISFLNGQGDDI